MIATLLLISRLCGTPSNTPYPNYVRSCRAYMIQCLDLDNKMPSDQRILFCTKRLNVVKSR